MSKHNWTDERAERQSPWYMLGTLNARTAPKRKTQALKRFARSLGLRMSRYLIEQDD